MLQQSEVVIYSFFSANQNDLVDSAMWKGPVTMVWAENRWCDLLTTVITNTTESNTTATNRSTNPVVTVPAVAVAAMLMYKSKNCHLNRAKTVTKSIKFDSVIKKRMMNTTIFQVGLKYGDIFISSRYHTLLQEKC